MSQGGQLTGAQVGDRAAFRISEVVWLAIFLAVAAVFPRGGEGVSSTLSWADQGLFLQTLNETVATGTSAAFSGGYVGPGYIALARLLQMASGAPAANSLALLSLFSFFATGIVLVAFVFRSSQRQDAATQNMLMAVTVAALFTSVWAHASDMPWTQFVETALLAFLVLLIATPVKRWFTFAAIGFVMVFAYQTRPYEGTVMLIALGLVAAVWLIAQRAAITAAGIRRAAFPASMIVLGGAAADAIIFALTHVALPISQYNALNSTFKILPSLLPYKFVQLFVDTCFAAVCETAPSVATKIFDFEPGWHSWRQPLSLQHPVLVAAGLAICAMLAGSPAARRAVLRPAVLFPLLAAGGALFAYTAGVPSGSPHLKFGFMRDYVAPMVLLFMAMCGLVAALPAAEDAAVVARARRWSWGVLSGFVVVVIALMAARPFSGNFLPAYAISDFTYLSQCTDEACRFSARVINKNGTPITVPGVTVFVKQCDGREIAGVADLDAVTYDPRACNALILLPAVTGLFQTPGPADHINGPDVGTDRSAISNGRTIF